MVGCMARECLGCFQGVCGASHGGDRGPAGPRPTRCGIAARGGGLWGRGGAGDGLDGVPRLAPDCRRSGRSWPSRIHDAAGDGSLADCCSGRSHRDIGPSWRPGGDHRPPHRQTHATLRALFIEHGLGSHRSSAGIRSQAGRRDHRPGTRAIGLGSRDGPDHSHRRLLSRPGVLGTDTRCRRIGHPLRATSALRAGRWLGRSRACLRRHSGASLRGSGAGLDGAAYGVMRAEATGSSRHLHNDTAGCR